MCTQAEVPNSDPIVDAHTPAEDPGSIEHKDARIYDTSIATEFDSMIADGLLSDEEDAPIAAYLAGFPRQTTLEKFGFTPS